MYKTSRPHGGTYVLICFLSSYTADDKRSRKYGGTHALIFFVHLTSLMTNDVGNPEVNICCFVFVHLIPRVTNDAEKIISKRKKGQLSSSVKTIAKQLLAKLSSSEGFPDTRTKQS